MTKQNTAQSSRYGGFVRPSDLETDKTETGTAPMSEPASSDVSEPSEKKKTGIWLRLGMVCAAVLLVFVGVRLLSRKEPNNAVSLYTENGFSVQDCTVRLVTRSRLEKADNSTVFLDEVFGRAKQDTEFAAVVPLVDTEAVSLQALKNHILVAALSFSQDSEVSGPVPEEIRLEKSGGEVVSTVSYSLEPFPARGVLYMNADNEKWEPGTYRLVLRIEDRQAFSLPFAVVK